MRAIELLNNPEALAKLFHCTYEQLAPAFGYKTRQESSKPWDEVPPKNKQLMIAVAKDVQQAIAELETKPEATKESPVCKQCENWEGECTSSIPCDMDFSAFRVKKPEAGEFTKAMREQYPKNTQCGYHGNPFDIQNDFHTTLGRLDQANAKIKELEEKIERLHKAFGLARSMVLSGEKMTPQAEKIFEQALAERKG